MDALQIRHLSKRFQRVQALSPLSLSLPDGAHLVVLGPSGSGKSTLLRLLAGLESPDSGSIHLDSTNITQVAPDQRRCGYTTSHPGLLPQLDLASQIDLPLRLMGWSSSDRQARVQNLIRTLGLSDRLSHLPAQLSSGEAVRTALARALAPRPQWLLLDEPFAQLDPALRAHVRQQLLGLRDETRLVIEVSHHPFESLAGATHLAILHKGRLIQFGPRDSVLEHPATPHVANLLASVPIVWIDPGKASDHGWIAGPIPVPDSVWVGVRMERARWSDTAPSGPAMGPVRIVRTTPAGTHQLLDCHLPQGGLIRLPHPLQTPVPAPGAEGWVTFGPDAVLLFPVTDSNPTHRVIPE